MTSRNMAIVIFAVVLSTLCHSKARYGRYTATVAEAMNLISTSYIEQTRPRDLLDGAMEGLAGKLDRYSGYIPPKSLKPFHEQLDQEFSGVGIVVEFDPETEMIVGDKDAQQWQSREQRKGYEIDA